MTKKGSVPHKPGLTSVLSRNIRTMSERRQRDETHVSFNDRMVAAITGFAGSMPFVYLHFAVFGGWLIGNLGVVPGVPAWDSHFSIIAMLASVEAIFLSTFVLISQNRMSALADKRADLDVQINLLAEHEITKLATVVEAVARHLDVPIAVEEEIAEVKQDIAPEAVLDAIEAASSSAGTSP